MALGSTKNQLHRKSPRRFFSGSVGVLIHGQYKVTESVSLGEGGIAFLWPTALPMNDFVVVTFKVPNHNMVSLRGVLRNIRNWDKGPQLKIIGVQFLPLNMTTKRFIRAFVSSRPENEPVV